MKKFSLLSLSLILLLVLSSCGGFKAERVSRDQADEKASEITDKWVVRDTEIAIKDVLAQISAHKGYRKYLSKLGREPKLFVAEVQNHTSEPYFPIDDMNDEMLNEFSSSGEYVLIDAAAREKILKEITYQNDGMVDPNQAKNVGKQAGADIMIFGAIRMDPSTRDGKTIKEYTVNLRMTDVEAGIEVLRVRAKVSKFSQQSKSGW